MKNTAISHTSAYLSERYIREIHIKVNISSLKLNNDDLKFIMAVLNIQMKIGI